MTHENEIQNAGYGKKDCTCEMYDDGDAENGPHLAIDPHEDCPHHGRAAFPAEWAEGDAYAEGYEHAYGAPSDGDAGMNADPEQGQDPILDIAAESAAARAWEQERQEEILTAELIDRALALSPRSQKRITDALYDTRAGI